LTIVKLQNFIMTDPQKTRRSSGLKGLCRSTKCRESEDLDAIVTPLLNDKILIIIVRGRVA